MNDSVSSSSVLVFTVGAFLLGHFSGNVLMIYKARVAKERVDF